MGKRVRARFVNAKRLGIAAATAFLTINIWTGAPLFALWVGSEFSDHKVLSMAAVLVVLLVLAVLVVVMALALTWLSNTYDELTDDPRANGVRPGCAACAPRRCVT